MSAVRVDVDYACGCVMFAVAFSHVGGSVVPDVCVNVLVDQGVVVEDTVSQSVPPPIALAKPWQGSLSRLLYFGYRHLEHAVVRLRGCRMMVGLCERR